MSRAWGFDFYLPSQRLLLRFERKFHDAYIAGTVRHDTFTQITYEEAIAQIHEHAPGHDAETLLTAMAQKSRHDAYYRAKYRSDLNTHDTNVKQRLRAWRPYLEVILPISLRQIMAAEVAAEYQIYTSL
jgi:CRISPR-associated protein (TIGR03985 family)